MTAVVMVLLAWLLFGGSHLLLSTPMVRNSVSNRLGASRFVVFYTLIAAVTISLLIVAVARYGGVGLAGPNLAAVPPARWLLGGIAFVGAALTIAGLLGYARSPMAVLALRWRASEEAREKPLPPGSVVERITRHPFFVGIALLMGAHALLASKLVGTLYFGGFVLLALIGIPMQDHKLRERHGELYGQYMANTSAMPFAAAGRASDIGDSGADRIWPALLAAIAGAIILALLHPLWQLGYGASFAALVLVGGLIAVARQLQKGRAQ